MSNTMKLLALLTALTLTLSACTAPPASQETYSALPPAEDPYDAPADDDGLAYAQSVALHMPNRSGQRLIVQYAEVMLRHDEHPARAILEALLRHPSTEDVRALNTGSSAVLALHGKNPVEISGGVCTVNLSSSALQLSYANQYTLCLSIAATLTELRDIDAVNVLIADQATAMDITGCLPLGTVTAIPGEELPVLWEQMEARRAPLGQDPSLTPLQATATLYFPLEDGSGFVSETRAMSFRGQHPRQLALSLVNALSAGAQYVSGAAAMPSLGALLNVDPIVTDLEDGGRLLTLRFNADLEEQLDQRGMETDIFLGAVHRTLITFIPSVSAMQVYIGDTLLTSLYSHTHGSRLFPEGVIRREDFSDCLMRQITLYLQKGEHLSAALRAVPQEEADSLRARIRLLSQGPTAAEASSGFTAVLPQGLTSEDILGMAVLDDTLLVNLSGSFTQAIISLGSNETLMCYALVNTLCDATQMKRIRFYFDGDTAGQLAGQVYWGGEFLHNPALIR